MTNPEQSGELVLDASSMSINTDIQVAQPTQMQVHDNDLSPLVNAVLDGRLDPDKLEKLLDIQKNYEAMQAEKAYHAAVSQFKKNAPTLKKDKTVSYQTDKGWTTYTHSSLGYALTKVNPALSESGLSLSFKTGQENGQTIITAILTHELGHSEKTALGASPDSSGGKNGIQSIASTVTYLKRHTAFALLGLEGIEDTDGNTAETDSTGNEVAAHARQEEKPAMYPTEKFDANIKKWRQVITEGKKTAEQIIMKIESIGQLTAQQRRQIRGE